MESDCKRCDDERAVVRGAADMLSRRASGEDIAMGDVLKALLGALPPGEGVVPQQFWRHRVKVTQSTKGMLSFECGVEGVGYTRDEALAESDALVAALLHRYPAQKEG
jgi:hypothetical protein